MLMTARITNSAQTKDNADGSRNLPNVQVETKAKDKQMDIPGFSKGPRSAIASIGVRYGLLVVTDVFRSHQRTYANCICDCGKQATVLLYSIRKLATRSCGCLHAIGNNLRHGDNRKGRTTAEYRIWRSMRQRCNNRENAAFPRYGGRGITVCERWSIFDNFLADMGRRPSSDHSLDRINNDGNYEPGNVRWATALQQSLNTRRNRLITFNGETRTLSEWTACLGFHGWTLGQRIRKCGWSIERAFTTPERQRTS
jgi:hypothetical protein